MWHLWQGWRYYLSVQKRTAPVVRSYVENKLFAPEEKPSKFYYIIQQNSPYERPRQRQSFAPVPPRLCRVPGFPSNHSYRWRGNHRYGSSFLERNRHSRCQTTPQHFGNLESCGIASLIDYLTPLKETLSKDSQRRLEENPLRVLDHEKEDKVAVENALSILDFLLMKKVKLTWCCASNVENLLE